MIQNKIFENTQDALLAVAKYKSDKKNIVFTNGCFDILHAGHVSYLEKAKALGNILIVGINTDASVAALKGPQRPIVALENRMIMLAALESVDMVIPFPEETPLELIKLMTPHILVKGEDYDIKDIVGSAHVIRAGGQVKTITFVDGLSTSNLIDKIQNKL